MPIYISRGKFTTDAVKGMLAKPENREEPVANLFKSCGGKLIGWHLTFGMLCRCPYARWSVSFVNGIGVLPTIASARVCCTA